MITGVHWDPESWGATTGDFLLLDTVLLGYKALCICIFAVETMDVTFRVFTAQISVFVFQLKTNFNCTVSFPTVLLDCFAGNPSSASALGLGLILLVWIRYCD